MQEIDRPDNNRGAAGSPEHYVIQFPDLVLKDKALVASMTRGLGWATEPERFLAAAEAELAWRVEQGVTFGWFKK